MFNLEGKAVVVTGGGRGIGRGISLAMADAGAAVLVDDSELSAERLLAELLPLIDDPARLEPMAAAARAEGHPDAGARVADLLEAAA